MANGRRSAPFDLSPEPVETSTTPLGFKGFYHASYQRLIRAALAIGAESIHEAEDLAQSAMIAVLENWSRIHSNEFAYARAVVRNTLIKERAHAARERRDGLIDWGGDGPGVSNNPDLTAIDDEAWVRHILAILPPMQRAVMRLTYEGFSPMEIGAKLKVPSTNVRSNLRLARNTLKQHHEVGPRQRGVPLPSVDPESPGTEK